MVIKAQMVSLQLAVYRQSRRALIVVQAGVLISLYGLYVEFRAETDPNYSAACDISSWISCTKALGSKYARGFGLIEPIFGADSILNQKNALYGVLGYSLLTVLQILQSKCANQVSLVAAIIMNISSVYLFIILVRMEVICLVCYSIYVVNALFLYVTIQRRSALNGLLGIQSRTKNAYKAK